MKNYNLFIIILALIGFVESCYIFSAPTYREGLDFLFVVPLMFTFCILYFGKRIIPYHENGLGLKIYYLIAIIRFLLQPFLIVISKGELNFRMPEANPSSYEVAVFIYCLEIIIACYVINRWYPIYFKRYEVKQIGEGTTSLNFKGKAILGIYILFLLARIGVWLPGMNILAVKTAASELSVVFEATIFNCVKVFIFIFFILKSKRNLHNPFKFRLFFFLAIVAGLLNFLTYFGSNRSFIYETAIATIAILIYIFPSYKKSIFLISMPFALSVMFYSYVTKQFADENTVSIAVVSAETATSNIVEEYANGLWTVARSYQSSLGLSAEASAEALIKDISDGFSALGDLPGFNTIIKSLASLKSSSDIFKDSLLQEGDRGQMLSLSGGFLIIGGQFLGWGLLLLGNYWMIKLLIYMEVKSKLSRDVYYKYMYLWMSILMGLVHCYCLQTIIFCWSKFILFYWVVLLVNKIGIAKKTKFKLAVGNG